MSTLLTLVTKFVADTNDYDSNLTTSAQKTADFQGNMEKAGHVGKMGFGIAAAGIGLVGGAIMGTIKTTSDWADTLDSLGDVLGTNADDSAALAVAIQTVGGDTESLGKQMAFLTKGLIDEKGELGATGQILSDMGIAFQDANGKMLPTTDILTSVADKLAAMPDGLEKTNLQVQLFGKSGLELSDTMNALAGGGLEAARQKASDLGLLLGEEGVNASIEMGKGMETLKLTGEGLAVTFASSIMPQLVKLLAQFNIFIQQHGPQIQMVFNWLGEHAPLVLGILGVAAVLCFGLWAAGAIAAAIPTLALIWPVLLIGLAIAALIVIVVLLWNKWKEGWDAIKTKLGAVWDFIRPIFEKIKEWLATTITNALNTAKTTFQTVGGIIKGIWDGISGAISTVIGWIDTFIKKLTNIKLPDWLTPGSPTPFEMGLRGIAGALSEISDVKLPVFQARVNLTPNNPLGANSRSTPSMAEFDYPRLGRAIRDAMLQVVG